MDWKTTIPAVVGGLAGIAGAFGFVIPPDVAQGIVAIALFVLGLFATSKPGGN